MKNPFINILNHKKGNPFVVTTKPVEPVKPRRAELVDFVTILEPEESPSAHLREIKRKIEAAVLTDQ